MIDYGKPASNQMQLSLDGLSQESEQLMDDARSWIKNHPEEWGWFMREAKWDSNRGRASSKSLVEAMRRQFHVSCSNNFTACFARIALEQDPDLKFVVKKSKTDGFTSAKL